MPQSLHYWEKNPWYPFDRRLGGSSQSGCGGEKNPAPAEIIPSCQACSLHFINCAI